MLPGDGKDRYNRIFGPAFGFAQDVTHLESRTGVSIVTASNASANLSAASKLDKRVGFR